jgi:hypothetical protein
LSAGDFVPPAARRSADRPASAGGHPGDLVRVDNAQVQGCAGVTSVTPEIAARG